MVQDNAPIDPETRERIMAYAKQLPFLVRCGYELRECAPGVALGHVHVSQSLAGGTGQLNGTELYGLLDCTAWFSVALMLGPDEAAVTHDVHFSILSAAPVGSDVSLKARVDKRGRHVAFVSVEAHASDRFVARATVTKSIIPLSQRLRHANT
jgi:acyl-coenzyme A thioesterase PaaI-like protein